MFKRRKRTFPIGVSVVVGLLALSTISILANSLLSSDEFNKNHKTEITEHDPDADTAGGGWSVEPGMLKLQEGTNLELHEMTHAHPTLSEALKEAGAAVTGEAIHF